MAKHQQTVFYSWQSDIPSQINKNFIQTALDKAVKSLASDDSISVEPVVDRDTWNVPGAPKIAEIILSKIDKAAVFVADVTIIGRAKHTRKLIPNPNVMVELGYALKNLEDERLILIANEAFGPIEKLPFDLKHRRVLPYSLKEKDFEENIENQEKRKKIRQELQTRIQEALEYIFRLPPKDTSQIPAPLLVLRGAYSLQQNAATTLGPRGGRVSLTRYGDRRKIVTRDGLTIANEINDQDYHVRLGMDQLSRVAEDVRDQAGDGAKTAMLLCYEMIKGGYDAVSSGAQLSDVLSGMDLAVENTISYIQEQTQSLNKDDIPHVAATAGGALAAKLLVEAFENSKPDGVWMVEEDTAPAKSSVQIQEGVAFYRGYLADDFANDPISGNCVFEDCLVIVCEGRISTYQQLCGLAQLIALNQEPVFILAEEIEKEVLQFLVTNNVTD